MVKRIFCLVVIGSLLLFAAAMATEMSKTTPIKKNTILRGDEPFPAVPYAPTQPRLTAGSPGDTVGWTQYDYQSNGSSGNRVALDSQGGVHFDWMNGIAYPTERKVSFNYVSPIGDWAFPGVGNFISFQLGDGYCQLSLTTDDRAAAAYHRAPTNNESTYVAIDVFTGLGSFDYYRPVLWLGSEHPIWPYITVDRNNRIHIVGSEPSPNAGDVQTVAYTRSSNGGTTWEAPAYVDTVITISPILTSSRVSDKVAIVYTHPFDTTDQWHNDAYYIQSNDGLTWDFRNGKINVTGYETDADSLCAYTDIDAVYDYNDNLHIIWNAQYLDDSTGGIYYNARLFHYSSGTGTISYVTQFDSTWYETGCDFPAWNFTLAKMSISVDPTNNALFTTYTSWNIGDCSLGGYANGDIFLQYSTDGGATWTLRGNATNSHTNGCEAGDCDSDHWSSMAELADEDLHIFYVNDKDAGGVVQTEGVTTDNPLLYLAYPNPVRTMAVPSAPELNFPYDDSTYVSGYFLFDWWDPIGVGSYTFELDDDPGFATPIITQTGIHLSEYLNDDSLEVGTYYWRVKSVGFYGESAFSAPWNFTVEEGAAGCTYVVGDVNNNGSFNGIDVTYGVGYFKGGNPPPYSCECTPGSTWFVAGDVNGNCSFNGIDITYMVSYFKGGNAPIPCPSCPPAR